MTKKNITILSAAIIVVIIILLLPIKLPMSIHVPCKIRPTYTWILELGNDGNVLTSLHNAKSGSIESYYSAVPERGDSYEFKLTHNSQNSWVEKGDTIGTIYSSLSSQEYAALTGRLKTSQANLNVLMTGEKESLIQQAQQQLNAAIENAEYLNNIYQRKKQLFDDKLISIEEIELYKSQAKQAEIDVNAKRAYLKSLQTGGKQEQINLVKNEIQSIEKELQVVSSKLNNYVIVSPIKGQINSYSSEDTILTVNSPKSVLYVPVAWQYMPLLKIGTQIELDVPDSNPILFTVAKITGEIQNFNDRQVVTLIGVNDKENIALPANLWLTGSLSLGDVSLWEFIKWKLQQTYEV